MPPLTTPARPLNPAIWRLLLVLACVLVFSFALNAKVAGYGQSGPEASTSSKLWAQDGKFETPDLSSMTTLLWLAAFLAAILLPGRSGRYQEEFVVAQAMRRQRYLHRFLRPPPAL